MDAKILVGGVIAAAMAGLTVGILIAPASGKKTRAELSDGCKKVMGNFLETVNQSIRTLRDNILDDEKSVPVTKSDAGQGGTG